MPLDLPPKNKCLPSDATKIEKTLRSIVAYEPAATSTYQFYEVIDAWLGPWGDAGYPIGYGKKYNIEFNKNPYLNSYDHPISTRWVRLTTVNLQTAIIGYVVAQVKAGKLSAVTERALREAAFASHPAAYRNAGLEDVAVNEVESLFWIFAIPIEEFNPTKSSFKATITQVVDVVQEPGLSVWLYDLAKGTSKWPIRTLEAKLGDLVRFLESGIKDLYGYPGHFY
jgi:hypothetical protein